jgi:ectoine hydroxylase-related dioxygenase (phytanoyl-CoA dioxygenase family)
MNKGDAVFIIGSIWHGAGENKTNPPERRIIYSCHMTRGSMRADENQYLAINADVIKKYEPEVQALLGYSVSHPNCGHVDMKDPITLMGSKEDPFGYGSFQGQVAMPASAV